jgi:hypothetical protein
MILGLYSKLVGPTMGQSVVDLSILCAAVTVLRVPFLKNIIKSASRLPFTFTVSSSIVQAPPSIYKHVWRCCGSTLVQRVLRSCLTPHC